MFFHYYDIMPLIIIIKHYYHDIMPEYGKTMVIYYCCSNHNIYHELHHMNMGAQTIAKLVYLSKNYCLFNGNFRILK